MAVVSRGGDPAPWFRAIVTLGGVGVEGAAQCKAESWRGVVLFTYNTVHI